MKIVTITLIISTVFFNTALNSQSIFENLANIRVSCISDGALGSEGTGIVIGATDKAVYIITAKHLIPKYCKDIQIEVFFYRADPKTPSRLVQTSGFYYAKVLKEHESLDLTSLVIALPDGHASLRFKKLKVPAKYRFDQMVNFDDLVYCFGHPPGNSADQNWKRVDTRIRSTEAEDVSFHIHNNKLSVEQGFSGGGVYLKQPNRLIGMLTGVAHNDVAVLRIDRILAFTELKGVTNNLIKQPRIHFPKPTKLMGYPGLVALALAGGSRYLSDREYNTYLEDGSILSPTEFETKHGKSLEEMYDQANFKNQLAYISGGAGLLLIGGAAYYFIKENFGKADQSPPSIQPKLGFTPAGPTLGLTVNLNR